MIECLFYDQFVFCVFERQRYFIKKAVSYIFVCKYIKRCDFVVPGVCKACDEVVLDWGGNVNRVFLIFILVDRKSTRLNSSHR